MSANEKVVICTVIFEEEDVHRGRNHEPRRAQAKVKSTSAARAGQQALDQAMAQLKRQ